jgi:putative ABC transport system permease protein
MDREIDEELRYHVESRVKDLVATGVDEKRAMDQALCEFGDLERITNECRALARRRERMMLLVEIVVAVRQDIGFAVRQHLRSPAFAAVTVLTLVLGIGAITSVFTVVNGVLLRPLPYHRGEELAMVWNADAEPDTFELTEADYLDWRQRSRSFADMAAFNLWSATVSSQDGAEWVAAAAVTPNFFRLLGVSPIIGAGFTPNHGLPGNDRVVVLSHSYWQRWFGNETAVTGKTLTINGEIHNIVGVMPREYRHPEPNLGSSDVRIWAPMSLDAATARRSSHYLRVIGRLVEGTSVDQASADLSTIARQLELEYPETNAGETAVVQDLRDQHVGNVRPALLLILSAAGLVLLIVCANIGSLVLARSHNRRREIAIRTSLGAGRGRLARQLMVEHTVLAVVAGAIGLVAIYFVSDLLHTLQGSLLSRVADIRVDLGVVLFTVVVSTAVGVFLGLVPLAEVAKADVRDVLNEESAGTGTGRGTHRFRSGMVVTQVCVAVVLLISTGLLTRSFLKLLAVPPGFDARNALTMRIAAPGFRYPDGEDRAGLFSELTTQLTALPGVDAVGLASDLPFGPSNSVNRFTFEGSIGLMQEIPLVEYRMVGPNYFRAMGIEILEGREFQPTDRQDGSPVAVINREMANMNRHAPNLSPLGQQIVQFIQGSDQMPTALIVGVVEDVLDDGFDSRPEPRVYFPYMQRPVANMTAVLRTGANPKSLVRPARQRIRDVDNMAPVGNVLTLDELVAQTAAKETLAMRIAIVFSAFGIILAAIGVYGLMAFVVGNRRREFAVRSALGAESNHVLGLVLRHTMWLTLIGVVGGIVLAAGVVRLLSSFLFGVATFDPISFVAAPALLSLVALAAGYFPAKRAMNVQPVEALRTM